MATFVSCYCQLMHEDPPYMKATRSFRTSETVVSQPKLEPSITSLCILYIPSRNHVVSIVSVIVMTILTEHILFCFTHKWHGSLLLPTSQQKVLIFCYCSERLYEYYTDVSRWPETMSMCDYCVARWSTDKNILCLHTALYIQKPNVNLSYTTCFIHTKIQTTATLYWANFHIHCITFLFT
jgi:hypothetical protein